MIFIEWTHYLVPSSSYNANKGRASMDIQKDIYKDNYKMRYKAMTYPRSEQISYLANFSGNSFYTIQFHKDASSCEV